MKKPLIDAALLAQAKGPLARRDLFNFVSKLPLAAGATAPSWYRIAQATGAAEADVFLYSEIGFYGTTADQFVAELGQIKADTINLHLNSPGGSITDGYAIYAALVAHPAKVIAHVDGMAASIASVIMQAADWRIIGENAVAMVHKPWSMAMGPAEDLRKEADVLDMFEAGINGIYVSRTGRTLADIQAMVAAETWLCGQACVDAGFADAVVPNKKAKAQASLGSDFYAMAFPNAPADVLEELGAEPVAKDADKPFDFETASLADFEKLLRGAGCSGKRAKAITNAGFKPVMERPGDAKQIDQPTATDRPGDAVRRAATVAAIWNATRAYPH